MIAVTSAAETSSENGSTSDGGGTYRALEARRLTRTTRTKIRESTLRMAMLASVAMPTGGGRVGPATPPSNAALIRDETMAVLRQKEFV